MSMIDDVRWFVRLILELWNSVNKRLRSYQELFDRVSSTIWVPVPMSMFA